MNAARQREDAADQYRKDRARKNCHYVGKNPLKVCDDYVTRPFEYQELVERIRAVLRRARPRSGEVVDAPPVRIDTRTRDVRVAGVRVQVAQKEYELLLRLAREPERVFTKAELLHDVWGYRATARTRTLDSHASRLRRKLRDAGASVALVENVWGVGYRLLGVLPLDV